MWIDNGFSGGAAVFFAGKRDAVFSNAVKYMTREPFNTVDPHPRIEDTLRTEEVAESNLFRLIEIFDPRSN